MTKMTKVTKVTKIEERLALAKPHERVVGRLVGVSNRELSYLLILSFTHSLISLFQVLISFSL